MGYARGVTNTPTSAAAERSRWSQTAKSTVVSPRQPAGSPGAQHSRRGAHAARQADPPRRPPRRSVRPRGWLTSTPPSSLGPPEFRRRETSSPTRRRQGRTDLGVGQPARHRRVTAVPQFRRQLTAEFLDHQLDEGAAIEIDDAHQGVSDAARRRVRRPTRSSELSWRYRPGAAWSSACSVARAG